MRSSGRARLSWLMLHRGKRAVGVVADGVGTWSVQAGRIHRHSDLIIGPNGLVG